MLRRPGSTRVRRADGTGGDYGTRVALDTDY
jgi:hypothetical protein